MELNKSYLASDKTPNQISTQSMPIETSPELALISIIMTEIGNGQANKVVNGLKELPIGAIDRKNSDKLLVMLLVQAWKYGRAELVPVILDAWQVVYPKEERIPFYVQLALIQLLDIEILSFVYIHGLSSRGVSYFGIMTDMINNHEYDVGIACDRITKAYGKIRYDMLITLQQIASVEENAIIINFLNEKIRKRTPYKDIPTWVLDFRQKANGQVTPTKLLPTFEQTQYLPPDIKITLPSDYTLIDLYRRKLLESDLSLNNFTVRLSKMTTDEKTMIFKPVLERLAYADRQRSTVLFRLYGPAMLSMDPTLDELRYGGKRMFISITNPEIDIDGNVEVGDWFTGSCDMCLLKIERRWHSVRKPLSSGGWRGCYCSWKCVRDGLITPVKFDGLPEADILTRSLVDQIEGEMKIIGIQDRQDNGNIIPQKIYNTITSLTLS